MKPMPLITLVALFVLLAGCAAPGPSGQHTAVVSDQAFVEAVQTCLGAMGYYHGPINGIRSEAYDLAFVTYMHQAFGPRWVTVADHVTYDRFLSDCAAARHTPVTPRQDRW